MIDFIKTFVILTTAISLTAAVLFGVSEGFMFVINNYGENVAIGIAVFIILSIVTAMINQDDGY